MVYNNEKSISKANICHIYHTWYGLEEKTKTFGLWVNYNIHNARVYKTRKIPKKYFICQ